MPEAENHINLKHKRGWYQFSYQTGPNNSCACELTIPRWFFGKKSVRGDLSEAQSRQIMALLEQI